MPCNSNHCGNPDDYCVTIAVLARDIDHMGHVNNAVYIQWVQMATQSFWEARASPQMVEETLWVALRHEIDYQRPTLLGDRISITLRLITSEKARAVFECLIHRDAKQVSRLMSTWCCVDAVSRRPKRITEAMRTTFGVNHAVHACSDVLASTYAAP